MLYRRRLPHVRVTEKPVFLTWRLRGSLPHGRAFHGGTLTGGQMFVAMDRLLDEATEGPFYLAQPAIADCVVEALLHGDRVLRRFDLHAFAVMPNHVHALLSTGSPVPDVMKSLKSVTARQANLALGHTGLPFWQEENFDRDVRNADEFRRIRLYIENNPVRAGLSKTPEQFRWSSAWPGWGLASG
jgi:REP element-mobilizing transposase RayT